MWDTAALVLGGFVAGIGVTVFCVFIHTVLGDVKSEAIRIKEVLQNVQTHLIDLKASMKTHHDVMTEKIHKIEKQVKNLQSEPATPTANQDGDKLDNRAV